MKISRKKLKTLDIDVTDRGFTIWITERMKNGHIVKHWLLDGSLVKKNGQIHLSNPRWSSDWEYRYEVEYDPDERIITLIDKKP